MEIVMTQAFSRDQCLQMMEIIKHGSVMEHHETYINKFIISQRLYRFRGCVYLFVMLNGKVITFEELKAGE